MLQTNYNDFLTECVDSSLQSLKHHEQMMKFADEQIKYWQERRQQSQAAWNLAYINYCDWLKKAGKEPENKRPSWKRIQFVKQANGEPAQ